MSLNEAARALDMAAEKVREPLCETRPDSAAVAAFDAWLRDARTCGARVIEGFAACLAQDGAAVRAALCLSWSSGQAEGQVDRLKPLKRSMYRRAKLDLPRRRFIPATGSTKFGDDPLQRKKIDRI